MSQALLTQLPSVLDYFNYIQSSFGFSMQPFLAYPCILGSHQSSAGLRCKSMAPSVAPVSNDEDKKYGKGNQPTTRQLRNVGRKGSRHGITITIRKRKAAMEEHRRKLKEALAAKEGLAAKAAAPDELELKAVKAMGALEEGERTFGSGAEVNLDSPVYWWHDKYRARKPKYLNRIHTGYEWNKYNRTHYDHDNPPPKVVQGYKFNIFYPDLVDKTKAPMYTIEEDGNGETCIIRFHAGPPYEDIAFRIVNKEWEYSHKNGFKCTFERGILHLYVNFQRHKYRR